MVERIFMQVNVTRRESEIQLDNNDFDERAQNYRRKQWILDGKDPDEMENLYVGNSIENIYFFIKCFLFTNVHILNTFFQIPQKTKG